jgi:valyl-tRNA synthetase
MDKHYPENLDKKWQDYWGKEEIYKFNPQGKEFFSIDTPPPTVSGEMHLGHLFSYTHQDIIARFQRQQGKEVFYPFGLDDNGLPTEKLVEKKKGIKGSEMDRKEFIDICKKVLEKEEPELIKDWKRIGMSCDFNLFYFTSSKEVQKLSQKLFLELLEEKRVYQKEAPIIWCSECQTAIAQAELEDKEEETLFNDIIFKLKDSKEEIIISTTRPELLSSCVSVFIHPEDKKNKELIGKKAIVPLFGQEVEIKGDKKVDPEKGSGIVMCCTFGDTADVEWYLSHSLPLRVSIDKKGRMNEKAGKYKGLKIREARKKIIEDLKKEGILKKQEKITHTINVHERCGHEIEILNTKQWFFKYLDLKNDFIEMGEKMNWYPDYIQQRYENWISGLNWDWCISRQRFYGIPIPLWYCEECGEILTPEEKDLPVNPLADKPKKKCSCGGAVKGEKDLLDTWFTSSLSPQIALSLLDNKEGLFPMDFRPQAHDIINTWLFYTVARSKIHFDSIPFKNIMVSGFVLDPKGEKMSKSKGNVIKPKEMLDKYPVDALRYWAASSSLGRNIRFEEKEIKKSHRLMTKLWNASRFALSHLENFEKKKTGDYLVDQWIIAKLAETTRGAKESLEKYEYAKAKNLIENFFWNDFCDNYLELIKWRLYGEEDEAIKESAKQTLYFVLISVLKLFAPYIPHITEEIYQLYFKEKEGENSIHLCLWPEIKEINKESEELGKLLVDLTSAVRKEKSEKGLSLKKEIKELVIDCDDSSKEKINKFTKDLKEVNGIKEIKFGKTKEGIEIKENIKIKIEFL